MGTRISTAEGSMSSYVPVSAGWNVRSKSPRSQARFRMPVPRKSSATWLNVNRPTSGLSPGGCSFDSSWPPLCGWDVPDGVQNPGVGRATPGSTPIRGTRCVPPPRFQTVVLATRWRLGPHRGMHRVKFERLSPAARSDRQPEPDLGGEHVSRRVHTEGTRGYLPPAFK